MGDYELSKLAITGASLSYDRFPLSLSTASSNQTEVCEPELICSSKITLRE